MHKALPHHQKMQISACLSFCSIYKWTSVLRTTIAKWVLLISDLYLNANDVLLNMETQMKPRGAWVPGTPNSNSRRRSINKNSTTKLIPLLLFFSHSLEQCRCISLTIKVSAAYCSYLSMTWLWEVWTNYSPDIISSPSHRSWGELSDTGMLERGTSVVRKCWDNSMLDYAMICSESGVINTSVPFLCKCGWNLANELTTEL